MVHVHERCKCKITGSGSSNTEIASGLVVTDVWDWPTRRMDWNPGIPSFLVEGSFWAAGWEIQDGSEEDMAII